MNLLAALLTALTMIVAVQPAAAEEIQPDVEYQGPRELGIASLGVSFKLPKGWTGGLPQGAEAFVVGREGKNGYVFITAQEATVAQAKAEMSRALPIDQLMMTPKGEATVAGSTITNRYTVTGGATELQGEAIAKIGKSGMGVMVLAVATPADLPVFQKVAREIVGSLKIVAPPKPPPAPKASTGGYWGKKLAGQRLLRFFHGSGYNEKQEMVICPSGQFARRFEGGGYTVNVASGAFVSQNGGTWSATGNASSGVLTLTYNDGRTASYNLSIDGDKLLLDGNRWLREPVTCQ